MKTLISWVAVNNDFKKNKEGGTTVNLEGPNYLFHKHFYNHDRHIILSSQKSDDNFLIFLSNKLKLDFKKHTIEEKYMDVPDVVNVKLILTKIQELLLGFKDDQIDLFISPGTPAMQVAWYLAHINLGLDTNLFQTIPGKFTKSKKSELVTVDVEKSSYVSSTLIHEQEINERGKKEINITDSIKPVYEQAKKIAQTDKVTTLILGSTGTGKEHLAQYIHECSVRKNKTFVPVNCSAFSDQLLESRLFGYKKGAFTGAEKDTKGIFELADGGSVFLDEIGDVSPYMQQSLLRVLQEDEITPVGGTPKKVNVRIIAATNKDIYALCEQEKFRWDLYYRLSVVELKLPGLLERGKPEILAMIKFFIDQKWEFYKKEDPIDISKEAMNILLDYHYPGNIRELENLISRFYVFFEGKKVQPEDLPERFNPETTEQPLNIECVEKQHIEKVLKIYKGNQKQTAEAIGWAINTLKSKMRKYGVRN
jgi:transcriptional regulator with PAS, ATPase and Fis domain